MKQSNFYALLSILVFGLLLVSSSCKKDKKELDREKFIGTYSVSETGTGGSKNYTLTISASSANETDIVLNNLFNLGGNLTATVSGSGISIPDQNDGNVTSFSGSGTLSGNTLTIGYVVFYFGILDNCTAVGTKQ